MTEGVRTWNWACSMRRWGMLARRKKLIAPRFAWNRAWLARAPIWPRCWIGWRKPRRQASPGGETAERVQQWQQEAAQVRREELGLLARDVSLLPTSAQLQYRYGLSLYLHQQPEQAEQALRKACELAPDNDHFLYTLALFYDNYQRYDEALDCLDRLVKLRPGGEEYEQLRRQVREKRSSGGNRRAFLKGIETHPCSEYDPELLLVRVIGHVWRS